MGLYRYITEHETKELKTVGDPDINEVLQEALLYDNTILIEESAIEINHGFFGLFKERKWKQIYTIYHESRAFDGSVYQARYMRFATNVGRDIVFAYLFGIINCGIKTEKEESKC